MMLNIAQPKVDSATIDILPDSGPRVVWHCATEQSDRNLNSLGDFGGSTFLLSNDPITLSKIYQFLIDRIHLTSFRMSVDGPARLMDVVFLIDATGSMAATLKGAHDKAAEIAIDLRVRNPDVKFQFGSVCYRDPVDCQSDVHEVHQLSDNMDSLV
jgi:hypothetical protein